MWVSTIEDFVRLLSLLFRHLKKFAGYQNLKYIVELRKFSIGKRSMRDPHIFSQKRRSPPNEIIGEE